MGNYIVESLGNGIAHLQINREKTFNSFDKSTWIEYRKLLKELDADDGVRIIIVSGKGETFSSGLDVKYLGTQLVTNLRSKQKQLDFMVEFQDCVATPLKISKPTIGLLHGKKNYGLALDLCVCFTIRVVTEDINISLKEIQIGLVSDMGFLQRMPHQSGNVSLVNRISLTGDPFDADECVEMGIVARKDVAKDYKSGMDRCISIAQAILKNQDWCIKGTKVSIQEMIENNSSVKDGLVSVAHLNVNGWDIDQLARNIKLHSRPKPKL